MAAYKYMRTDTCRHLYPPLASGGSVEEGAAEIRCEDSKVMMMAPWRRSPSVMQVEFRVVWLESLLAAAQRATAIRARGDRSQCTVNPYVYIYIYVDELCCLCGGIGGCEVLTTQRGDFKNCKLWSQANNLLNAVHVAAQKRCILCFRSAISRWRWTR